MWFVHKPPRRYLQRKCCAVFSQPHWAPIWYSSLKNYPTGLVLRHGLAYLACVIVWRFGPSYSCFQHLSNQRMDIHPTSLEK